MPIYAYKCESCGFAKDVLQKLSDAPLDQCPSCGAQTFRKQVTAAGFQLKGSGWYVTDFRDGNTGAKKDDKAAAGDKAADAPAAAPADGAAAKDAAAPPLAAAKSESAAAAPAATPAAAATPAPAPSVAGNR